MRRFLHRKGQTSRSSLELNSGQLSGPRLWGAVSGSPNHVVAPTGRVRAPALRSRSMSVLHGGSETDVSSTNRQKKFAVSRSLSFSDDHYPLYNGPPKKLLTQSEEDEVFNVYTRKLYVMFAFLVAMVTGFVIYAFVYNMGKSQVK